MNKVFKVVWSKAKNCYVVVSEIAKNQRGKKKSVVAVVAALAMMSHSGVVYGAVQSSENGSTSSFTIGRGAKSNGTNAMAVGVAAQANTAKSVAIGSDAIATGYFNNNSDFTGATSVGGHSNAVGRGAVAMGYRTKATGDAVTAIGSDAVGCCGCWYFF